MDPARVREALAALGAPRFRWDQVRRAVFGRGVSSYSEVDGLPEELARELEERSPLLAARAEGALASPDGRARKAALALSSGGTVETVLLRPSPRRWTACVSTQVGCAVGCSFCATGLMGLKRSLAPEEITDQVLFWRQAMAREGLPGRLDNVVYMGMGEPFACYEQTAESLRRLLDPKLFGMGARRVSVSTSGVAPKIEAFGRDFPQVNLAVSLHAAEDSLRERLVPMNKAYPLSALAAALRAYLAAARRKVFFEYVLLRGENDRPRDAADLLAWLSGVGPRELLHVNLIIFNRTDTPHAPSSEEEARRFQGRLLAAGLKSTLRQNLGRDIAGACGQLLVKEAVR